MAADGNPRWGSVALLLAAAFLVRCAAWVFNDWLESRLLPEAPESFLARGVVSVKEEWWMLGLLLGGALLLLLPLPAELFYFAWAAPLLLAAYPFLKTRLLLTQPYLGLCHAWLVPLAYAAQGVLPGKTAWLLFTATLLWASAFTTLYALPRRSYEQRVGIRSLAQLFGGDSWLFITVLQLGAIFSLWLTGQQMALGLFFSLGLLVAILLIPYQLWLLFSHPLEGPLRSYRAQIWSGLAVMCGTGFHYLCQGQ
jgi:4-hydroxybenzoate polyprenyltransferase